MNFLQLAVSDKLPAAPYQHYIQQAGDSTLMCCTWKIDWSGFLGPEWLQPAAEPMRVASSTLTRRSGTRWLL